MQESIDTIWVIDCVRAGALSSCVWFDKKAPIRTVCYYRACVLFGNWLHLFDGERWDWWRVKPWRIRTPRALDSMQSAACYLRCRKNNEKTILEAAARRWRQSVSMSTTISPSDSMQSGILYQRFRQINEETVYISACPVDFATNAYQWLSVLGP